MQDIRQRPNQGNPIESGQQVFFRMSPGCKGGLVAGPVRARAVGVKIDLQPDPVGKNPVRSKSRV
jgi:hypothetical protein